MSVSIDHPNWLAVVALLLFARRFKLRTVSPPNCPMKSETAASSHFQTVLADASQSKRKALALGRWPGVQKEARYALMAVDVFDSSRKLTTGAQSIQLRQIGSRSW